MEFFCTFRITNYTFNSNGRNVSGYTCRVTKINFSPSLKSIIIHGDHQESLTNEDVIGVIIENNKLERIPYGLTKHFPKLQYLQIRKCGLKTLSKTDLVEFDQLRGLWLPDNDISILDNGTFDNQQGLRYLCFFQNRLKFIGSEVLKPLKNLTDANFLQNTCINKDYKNGNKEQFNALIEEIIKKCQQTTSLNDRDEAVLESIEHTREIKRLNERILHLENSLINLEQTCAANNQANARIDKLEKIISDMQLRLPTVHG